MTTARRLHSTLSVTFALAALAGFPESAFASVQITELMYDVSGTDTGREWIEITNRGTSAVDISGYKLFEGDANHALTVVSGSPTLAAGAAAVLVEDATKFGTDWPNVSSAVLKASFSLSNTGETLVLKDSTLNEVDKITYEGSVGAAGDGNSLHRSGSSFVPGAPDPGVYASTIPASIEPAPGPAADPSHPSQTTTAAQPSSQSGGSVPTITSKITTDTTVIVGAGSFFTAAAYGTKGEKIADARFIWNFGDGATAEGANVFHTYDYPGKYSVMLSVGSDLSASVSKATVQAIPAQLALMTETDGSVMLVNRAGQELLVGLWSITSGTTTFVIPTGTAVLAGQSIRFSPTVMKMHAANDATLQYPNGVAAVSALPRQTAAPAPEPEPAPLPTSKPSAAIPKSSKIATHVVLPPPAPLPQSAPEEVPAPAPNSEAFLPFSGVPDAPTAPPTPAPQPKVEKPQVKAAALVSAQPAAAAAAGFAGISVPIWEGGLGLVALVMLGLCGVWYSRSLVADRGPRMRRNSFSIDEFDIEG